MKFYLILSISVILISGCTKSNKTQSFFEISSPVGENSSLAHLYSDESGTVFLSWVEEKESAATFKYASFDGKNWSESNIIASDSTWFLNWADFPSIISKNGLPFAAHWLNKKPGGTYSYDVNISTYVDDKWTQPITPHKDNTQTEHGFVSMVPVTDSTFMAVWLDGRETNNRDHSEYSNIEKAMTLRGALIHKNGTIISKYLIDDSVCDCCNTSLTKTDKGLVLVYRNRTSDEIRDIYYSSFSNGDWTTPKSLHSDEWEIAACPVNGPSIDSEKNTVAAAWFSGADNSQKTQLAISNDFGESFNKKITMADQNPIGRVDVEIRDDKIWVSWLSSDKEEEHLVLTSYTTSGKLLDTVKIPNISSNRQTGFPQLEIIDEKLLIAFTDASEETTKVRIYRQN